MYEGMEVVRKYFRTKVLCTFVLSYEIKYLRTSVQYVILRMYVLYGSTKYFRTFVILVSYDIINTKKKKCMYCMYESTKVLPTRTVNVRKFFRARPRAVLR